MKICQASCSFICYN